jgi:hypothetical protein
VFSFRGAEQLDDLARRLRDVPRRLTRELERELGAAARPAAQDVRESIKRMSLAQKRAWNAKSPRKVGRSLGRGSSPLRSSIAQAVALQVRARGDGVRVDLELQEQRVPQRARWLVPYVVGRKKRLRHPFMGKWRRSVQATGQLDQWWPVLKKHTRKFAAARDRAVERIDRYIERG